MRQKVASLNKHAEKGIFKTYQQSLGRAKEQLTSRMETVKLGFLQAERQQAASWFVSWKQRGVETSFRRD